MVVRSDPRRVYIASSWRNHERVDALARKLREMGFICEPFTSPVRGISERDREVIVAQGVLPDPAVVAAHQRWDMENIRAAGIFVLMLPCGNDSHVELGVALAAGARIYILGEPERPGVFYHGATVCADEAALLAALALREGSGGRAAGGERAPSRRRKRIYIAAPYAKGDVAENVRRAILAADELLRAGHIPFCPHLSHFWHLLCPKPRDLWLGYGLEWLAACDALVRLPGESEGADAEVAAARAWGIPVYGSVAELLEVEGGGTSGCHEQEAG